jgi:hypothetical protein
VLRRCLATPFAVRGDEQAQAGRAGGEQLYRDGRRSRT